jgi:hypothetical protein
VFQEVSEGYVTSSFKEENGGYAFLRNVIIAHFDTVRLIKITVNNIESPWMTNTVKAFLEMNSEGFHSIHVF